jgi:type I restriction enzyme S subunit
MGVTDKSDAHGLASVQADTQGVPRGYKRTDIGVIPVDWDVTSVDAEFSVQLGKMLDSEKNTGVSRPFLGNRAVQWGRVELSGIGEIRLTPADLQRYRLHPGDLLVCEGGEVGRSAVWNGPLDECYYQKALHRLRPKRGYSVHLMQSMLQRMTSSGYLQNFVTQTSIAHLPKDKFLAVQLPLPASETEQNVIVEALSDADALIESLDQLIAKKRDLKQAAMQQLLTGKIRLPGFEGEWEAKRLGELSDMASGGTPLSSIPAFYSGGIPWVSIADMTRAGRVLETTEKTLTALGLERSAAQLFPEGTVLYAMYASLGECCIAGLPVTTSQAILGIRAKQRLFPTFLYYTLDSMKTKVRTLGQQGTQANLNKAIVQSFEIALPSREEQISIATVLSDIDAELTALEARRDKARLLKQGMMQELLAGRIRLV